MLLQLLTVTSLILARTSGLEPGVPGKPWTAQEVKVIRMKLKIIWQNAVRITQQFDPNNQKSNVKDQEYLYDPNNHTTVPDCINESKGMCPQWWGGNRRNDDIAFKERKMLRLAFHDCIPYEDGTGGCDGCLNLDENLEGNDGLQFTAAVLEKLYIEADFPEHKILNNPDFKLDASPKDLGISRADLWAFAGLVALDEFQQKTKAYCDVDAVGKTCDQAVCYKPFEAAKFASMFSTGRSDCDPKKDVTAKQKYLSSKIEAHPNKNGAGQDTVNYFEMYFGLGPRAGLALMGVHTVGQFNPMTAHVDYAWVRDRDNHNEVFNNEYYQMMSRMPYYIKSTCTGTMDNKPAEANFRVSAHVFTTTWRGQTPYAGPGNPGELTWRLQYRRGPTCDYEEEDARGGNEFWGKEVNGVKLWQSCCEAKKDECGLKGNCPEECTKWANARLRFTSSEVGYYLDFKFDNQTGLPYGCDSFENTFKPGMTQNQLRKIGHIISPDNLTDCPKQVSIKDETNNQPLYKTVEYFAKRWNLAKWQNEFLDAYRIMATNKNTGLTPITADFNSHGCCFFTNLDYDRATSKKIGNTLHNVSNAVDCQNKCYNTEGCEHFIFVEPHLQCRLFEELGKKEYKGNRFVVSGPRKCRWNQRAGCAAFK